MSASLDYYSVSDFYKDKTILLTGSTGYLGTILLERLIRNLPDIKKIFILVRSKHGKTSSERLETYFSSEVFDSILKECPSSLSKVICIEGNITSENCGLKWNDVQMIHKEVNLVIHSAAIIKFNEEVYNAININVVGTLNILELSKGINNLQCFMYVSTMFVNCHNNLLEETVYINSISPENLLKFVNLASNNTNIKNALSQLIGDWPNSYTFTKNIAENLVQSYESHMPIVIFRPGIITAPYKEPASGWINKINMGPYGWITATGLGISRIVHISHPEANTNIVPSDYVANAIIVVIWDVGIQRRKTGTTVINYTTTENPISWNNLNMKLMENYTMAPFASCRWYPMSIIEPSVYHFRILRLFLQRVPAYFIDLLSILVNKERKSVKWDSQFAARMEETWPFLKDFNFPTDNINIIWNKLLEQDKREFNFNTKMISWDEYVGIIHFGIKKYLFKETITQGSSRKAKINFYWLSFLDKTFKLGLLSFLFYLLCFIS